MVTRIAAALLAFAGLAVVIVVARSGDDTASVDTAAVDDGSVDGGTGDAAVASGTGTGDDPTDDADQSDQPRLDAAPDNLGPRMDLVDLDGWLNTDITSLDDLDGKVILVEMWTFGCRNCKARLPHNQDLYASLPRDTFEIVGVHAPEFAYEAEVANIEDAIERLGVTWPVALDTDKTNFRAWQAGGRRFWPRTYVIDQNGDVRFDHIGEGRYDELEATITYLLDNPPPARDA